MAKLPTFDMNNLFETKRLAVRNLRPTDFALFNEMQADDVVMRYTTGQGLDEQENLRQLESCIESYSKPDNQFWVWAITKKSSGHFIGTCAIVPYSGSTEIGYRLLRSHFGNGFGQEICDGLIEYGIQSHQLSEIVAYVDLRNTASRIILDRSKLIFIEETANDDGGTDRFYRWQSKT